MNTHKNGFRLSLAVKISLIIIIISTLVACIVSIMNYNKYLNAVYTVHADFAQNAGDEIAALLSPEQWKEYVSTLDAFRNGTIEEDKLYDVMYSDKYQASCSRIQSVVDARNFRSVSVFAIDQPTMDSLTKDNFDLEESYVMTFLMDFYPSEESELTYEYGDSDIWWGDYEGFADYQKVFSDLLTSGEGWWLTETLDDGKVLLTEYYPVLVDDEVVAIIMLSTDAIEITDFLHSFFVESLVTALGIALLLTLISVLVLVFQVVRPLKIIRKDAEEYIQKKAELSARLGTIKTHDEIQDLAGSFLQMEKDIQAYIAQVQTVTAEKERIQTELALATRIQTDMLPTVFPPFPERKEFNVYASMNPAKEVGGDFYDFFLIDDNHLGLVIADVAGKGVPAALFMTISKTLIKNRAQMGGSPSEILFDVNNQLCGESVESMFVTVWMAIIDLTTGEGIAANAGHEHPIRRDAGGTYELLKYRHSVPVATMDGMRFREHTFKLNPGDRIFVYTDGVPEAINRNAEEYGTDRLLHLLNECGDLPFDVLLKKVSEDVKTFANGEPQFDDMTMVVFDFFGK